MTPEDFKPALSTAVAESRFYASRDGRYSSTIIHAGGRVLMVKHVGYQELDDARSDIASFQEVFEDLQARGIEGPYYLCIDATEFEGASYAARKHVRKEVKHRRAHVAAIAGYGVGPLIRSIAALFQVLRWSIGIYLFDDETAGLSFLRQHEREPARLSTETPAPAAAVEGTSSNTDNGPVVVPGQSSKFLHFLNQHLPHAEVLEFGGFEQRVLQPEDWIYTSPDNSFRCQAVLVGKDIVLTTMRGYLDQRNALALGALREQILSPLAGLHLYFVHDCQAVTGASLAARREVLSWQGPFGAIIPLQVFVGEGETEMLMSWARTVAPEAFQSIILRDSVTVAFEEIRQFQAFQPESMGNAELDHSLEFSYNLKLGGRTVRVIRPPHWSLESPEADSAAAFSLVGDDTLYLENRGVEREPHTSARLDLMEQVLSELGGRKLHYIHDDRGVSEVTSESRRVQIEHFRANRELFSSTTHIGSPATRKLLTLVEPILAAIGHRVQTASSLEEAWLKSHGLDPEPTESASVPQGTEQRALDPTEVEQLLDLQTDRLHQYHSLSQRLLEGMTRITWEDSHEFEPIDLDPASPFAALFSSLELLQKDFREILAERDKREAELAKAQIEAEAANRSKTEFLATVSHELRTPLTPIIGLIERLQGTSLNADQRSDIDGIQRAAGGLLRQVSDLLDFATIESGKLRLKNRPCDLSPLLTSALELHRQSAEDKGLSFRLRGLSSLPPLLEVDPVRFRQVLDNLVNNAIKFTERGSIVIDVNAEPGTESELCRVKVAVKDTGLGVPEQEALDIFGRFSRGQEATDSARPGVGLGLAIASNLVELMGGLIGLESTGEQGSTFWFELDLRVAARNETGGATAYRGSDYAALPGGVRILLVDDNEDIRNFAAQVLRDAGCQTFAAGNGAQALDQLLQQPVDLILMDCKMPVMDGYETTEELRRLGGALGDTPVVALTAYALEEERERCYAAGMNDYLTKPFSRTQLFSKISRNLRTRTESPTARHDSRAM